MGFHAWVYCQDHNAYVLPASGVRWRALRFHDRVERVFVRLHVPG